MARLGAGTWFSPFKSTCELTIMLESCHTSPKQKPVAISETLLQ
jgi:hypothetical protein